MILIGLHNKQTKTKSYVKINDSFKTENRLCGMTFILHRILRIDLSNNTEAPQVMKFQIGPNLDEIFTLHSEILIKSFPHF